MDNNVMMIQPCEDESIYFSYADCEGLDPDQNQALVVTLDVAENEVKRILVDNGSSANIVFEHTLNRMKLGHLRMNPFLEDPLYGFENSIISIQGVIYLPVTFGTTPRITNADAQIQKFIETKEKTKVESAAQIVEIELDPENPIRKVRIGKVLDTTFQKELVKLLKEYADVFSWAPEDMPGIDESVAMHSLDVDPKQRPIKKKRRNFAPE
ncbi:uncharacterized protein LOC141674297 [Apium graveolens]|uniref:uncharacterized protein LOC141674297 n=1 Tax=Apium graveolens TaxID=4045 RepID=UPI003D79CEDF